MISAQDGLWARDNGAWGADKLDFLHYFGPPALKATQAKHTRHYVELFAGPGMNVVREGQGSEFEGSPLRALQLHAPNDELIHFTHAVFINKQKRDHEALQRRVAASVASGRSLIEPAHVVCCPGDANQVLPKVLESIDPLGYVFVFADLESPHQLPWTSVERLRRQRSHKSVDLYVLFPLDMGLKRLISYNTQSTNQCAHVLTEFFGTTAWTNISQLRQSDAPAKRAEVGRQLEALYLGQLRTIWKHAEVVCDVRRGQSHKLYKMVFASDHDAGAEIGRWAKRKAQSQRTNQFELRL